MNDAEITPEHTCGRIGQVLEELEGLRLEMGRHRDTRVAMQVENALPREVHYFAQTVHRKANRLCVELGGAAATVPSAVEPANARPADVLRMIDSIRARLFVARGLLRIEGDTFQPELPGPLKRDLGKTPSDTLAGCLSASRQLNVMLATAFTSREGFDLMTRALALSQRLLARHNKELPPLPPLERRKFPRDVFQVLWGATQLVGHLVRSWKVPAMVVYRGYVGEDPTDVVDLASVIVAELDHLASFLPPGNDAPLVIDTPATVLPLHNHQRARQLSQAIWTIADTARTRPDWMP